MSNETKRDVFEAVLNRLAGYQVFFNGWPRETLYDYKKRYEAALPDETDNQKSCPYCHSKSGHKISQDAYSFWYRNKRFKPLFCSNCGRKL